MALGDEVPKKMKSGLQILDKPLVPDRILQASSRGRLVIFVGAGVSRIIGCPSWEDFANELLDYLYKRQKITYFEKSKLSELPARKILSICLEICKEQKIVEPDFKKIFCCNPKLKNIYRIFENLYAMNAIYVTTNYDEYLDKEAEKAKPIQNAYLSEKAPNGQGDSEIKKAGVFYRKDEIYVTELLLNGNVIHIHGSIKDTKTMVITLADYMDRYFGETNKLPVFLHDLFDKYTVLFVGYGLEEYEILEFMMSKMKKDRNYTSHYILMPFFANEHKLVSFLEKYYQSMGIELIPYSIDEKGYYQLDDVIQDWASQIGPFSKPQNFLDKIRLIDEVLNNEIRPPKEEAVLRLIEENKEYQDYFFYKVKDIKWFYPLKERGLFKPENAPGPVSAGEKGGFYIPDWNILPYLESVAQQAKKPDNDKYIKELLDIIRNVSNITDSSGQQIDNYRIWHSFINILVDLPNEKIPFDIIELIPRWLESNFETSIQGEAITAKLVPKFLNEQSTASDIEKAEEIIKHVTSVKAIPLNKQRVKIFKEKQEFKFRFDPYWLEKMFSENQKIMELIVDKCTLKIVEALEINIRSMLFKKEDGAYQSLYDDGWISDPLGLLTKALRFILNEKVKKSHNEIKKLVIRLLGDKFYYFQKMAMYVIGNNYEVFQDVIFENLDKIIGASIIRNYLVGDELRHLLEKLKDLSLEQKELIRAKVDKGPKKGIPKEDREKYILLWKQKIYHAVRGDPYFELLYDNIKKETGEDTELAAGIVRFEMKFGKDESPLSAEEILKKTNKDLAEFIRNYRSKDYWMGPTADGLSTLLKEVVQKQPEKFTRDLTPFLKIGYLYNYDILWGLRDAWKENKIFDWKCTFSFIKKYINQEGFWEDKLKVEGSHWKADHNWVLKQIGGLIQEGTRDDSRAFDDELIPDAEAILITIVDHFLGSPSKEGVEGEHDPVTHALNSPEGNIVTALIYLTLRKARIAKRQINKSDEQWSQQIKTIYEKLLDGHIDEAFTLLGQYLPNFMFLDKKWIKTQIEKIYLKNDHYWSNFFIGYLYAGQVYLDLFALMKQHYERALEIQFKEMHAEERLVQHIAIGYLSSTLRLEKESLIQRLLDNINPEKMNALVRYLRSYSEGYPKKTLQDGEKINISDDISVKVMEIWRYMYNKYEANADLSNDEKDVLSRLLMLAVFLPEIDEEKTAWILFSLESARGYYDSHFLIEDLLVLKDRGEQPKTARYIGKILEKIVHKAMPTMFKDNIKNIVEFLYESKDAETKTIANDICDTYGRNGVHDNNGELFLRDIWEKYNT